MRRVSYSRDLHSGAVCAALENSYDTVSYRQLRAEINALAAEWFAHRQRPVREGDFIAVLGFAGKDYTIIDLAAARLGLVCVPLQTGMAAARLQAILAETQPKILAASLDCLPQAAALAQACPSVARILVFNYDARVTAQAARFNRLQAEWAEKQPAVCMESLSEALERGRRCAPAPFPAETDADPLAMLLYTSGSTGAPKGAMYTERVCRGLWRSSLAALFDNGDVCSGAVTVCHFMPFSHAVGQLLLKSTLYLGGVCYFTANSDMSSFFDDMGLARPTKLLIVPRMCSHIFHKYSSELAKRRSIAPHNPDLERDVKAYCRAALLGGQIRWACSASAHLSDSLRVFMESLLGIPLYDLYGSTELAAGIWCNHEILSPPVEAYKLADVPELGYSAAAAPRPRGELYVKASSAIPGYYRRPDLNSLLFDAEGYYKTGDIVEEIGKNKLRFIERRRNVTKLAQGEFVTLARLESLFADSPFISQIFVHAKGEWENPMAVIVPPEAIKAQYQGRAGALKRLIAESLRQIAARAALRPYEMLKDFIVEEEAFSFKNGLFTEFGKPRWAALRLKYETALDALYSSADARDSAALLPVFSRSGGDERAETVLAALIAAARAHLGLSADAAIAGHTHFRDMGGDSLAAVSFALLAEEIFHVPLPLDILLNPAHDFAFIAAYIAKQRQQSGGSAAAAINTAGINAAGQKEIYARDLKLARFFALPRQNTVAFAGGSGFAMRRCFGFGQNGLAAGKAAENAAAGSALGKTVLLTGATGYLGRFIALELLELLAKDGGTLLCLIRAQDEQAGSARLQAAFGNLDENLAAKFAALSKDRLRIIIGDVTAPHLGLSQTAYEALAKQADSIFHIGAWVNHVLPYHSLFAANVGGAAALIRFAIEQKRKNFIFMSSIAAAQPQGAAAALDEVSDIRAARPRFALNNSYANGYAASKWAAEALLREAHETFGLPVTVFRSGMILAHRRYKGQLNMPDMFSRLLLSIIHTGIAPQSFYKRSAAAAESPAHYDGLAVDFVAKAVVALGVRNNSGYKTYNAVNPHQDGVSLDIIADWLAEAGFAVQKRENYAAWLAEFTAALRELPEPIRQKSFLPLLSALTEPAERVNSSALKAQEFSKAVQAFFPAAAAGAAEQGQKSKIPPISRALIEKYIADFKILGLL